MKVGPSWHGPSFMWAELAWAELVLGRVVRNSYFSSKFNLSQCDKSLAAGFIPINTCQQRASMPFKPAQGHRPKVKM